MGKGTGTCDRAALELGEPKPGIKVPEKFRELVLSKNRGLYYNHLSNFHWYAKEYLKVSKPKADAYLEELYQEGLLTKTLTKTFKTLEKGQKLEEELDYNLSETGALLRSQKLLATLSLPAQDVLGVIGEKGSCKQAEVGASLGMSPKVCAQVFEELLGKEFINKYKHHSSGVQYSLSGDGGECRKLILDNLKSPWARVLNPEETDSQESQATRAIEPDFQTETQELTALELDYLLKRYYGGWSVDVNPHLMAISLGIEEEVAEQKLDSLAELTGFEKAIKIRTFYKDGKDWQKDREVSYELEAGTQKHLKKLKEQVVLENLSDKAQSLMRYINKHSNWQSFDLEKLEVTQSDEVAKAEMAEALAELIAKGHLKGSLKLEL